MYIDHLIDHIQEHKYLYMIEHRLRSGFLLCDFAYAEPLPSAVDNFRPLPERQSAAVWFPSPKPAMKFATEEDVEGFKSKFMSDRPVMIVRVEAEEHLRRLLGAR